MLSRFHLIPERHGQTNRIAISVSRVSVLTRDKNTQCARETKVGTTDNKRRWTAYIHRGAKTAPFYFHSTPLCQTVFYFHIFFAQRYPIKFATTLQLFRLMVFLRMYSQAVTRCVLFPFCRIFSNVAACQKFIEIELVLTKLLQYKRVILPHRVAVERITNRRGPRRHRVLVRPSLVAKEILKSVLK